MTNNSNRATPIESNLLGSLSEQVQFLYETYHDLVKSSFSSASVSTEAVVAEANLKMLETIGEAVDMLITENKVKRDACIQRDFAYQQRDEIYAINDALQRAVESSHFHHKQAVPWCRMCTAQTQKLFH